MRLCTTFVVGLVFVVLGCVVLNAQLMVPQELMGVETPLRSLEGIPLPPDISSVPCGRYFVFHLPPDPTQMSVLFAMPLPGTKKVFVQGGVPMYVFEVHVWPGPVAAKAKIVRAVGPILPWIEINVSSLDFEAAPCLEFAGKVRHHV